MAVNPYQRSTTLAAAVVILATASCEVHDNYTIEHTDSANNSVKVTNVSASRIYGLKGKKE